MTTSFQLDATLEFAARTGSIMECAPQRPVLDMPLTLPSSGDDGLILLPEGEDWSTLNHRSRAAQCRRALRTRAPFVLADLLALTLSALIAQATMWLVYPPAAAFLGPAAPFALFPLIAAYGLSALYSEIWVHPVIEFRQLTHVSTLGLLAAAVGGSLAWPFPLWCAAAWIATVILVPLFRTVQAARWRTSRACCWRRRAAGSGRS
jgi:hypothetical protein